MRYHDVDTFTIGDVNLARLPVVCITPSAGTLKEVAFREHRLNTVGFSGWLDIGRIVKVCPRTTLKDWLCEEFINLGLGFKLKQIRLLCQVTEGLDATEKFVTLDASIINKDTCFRVRLNRNGFIPL